MNLDKRQKVIITFIIIAIVVLVWQLYALIGGNQNIPAPTVEASKTAVAVVTVKPELHYPSDQVAAGTMADVVANEAASGQAISAQQRKYLALVSAYQITEVEKMIAADEAAIAQSRYETAQALAKIAQLAVDNNQNNFMNFALPSSTNSENDNYDLIYTGEENGQWTATLKKDGQFNDVTAGSVLPDGTKVLMVDDNSVLIKQNGTEQLVTFNGVIPFVAAKTAAPAALQNQLVSKNSAVKNTPVTITPAVNEKPAQKSVMVTTPKISTNNANEKKSLPAIAVIAENKIPPKKTLVGDKNVHVENLSTTHPDLTSAKIVAEHTVVKSSSAPAHGVTSELNANNFLRLHTQPYTVQLIADPQLQIVNQFIKQNALSGKVLVLKTSLWGKIWYIGVYGQYVTRAAAQQAIEQLPQSARAERPFVKRIDDIHSAEGT